MAANFLDQESGRTTYSKTGILHKIHLKKYCSETMMTNASDFTSAKMGAKGEISSSVEKKPALPILST